MHRKAVPCFFPGVNYFEDHTAFRPVKEMKKIRYSLILALSVVVLSSMPVLAQEDAERDEGSNRAVNINLGNSGAGLDNDALRSIRKLAGKAVASGVIDSFVVYSPRAGGPVPIEGGLSACAEQGFGAPAKKFSAFVSQLRGIHPRPGTFLNVELADHCEPAGSVVTLRCGGIAGAACPGAQQYCDFAPGKCKMPDAQGTCKTKPAICTRELKPVCGCDGKTYGNACTAAAAGISIEHNGECKKSEPVACGGIAGIRCPSGSICVDDPADDCDPNRGGADCAGICVSK